MDGTSNKTVFYEVKIDTSKCIFGVEFFSHLRK